MAKSKPTPKTKPAAAPPARPDRIGRVVIAGHFDTAVSIELKMICARERITLQSLLAEAINRVFADRGRPEIAV